MKIADVLKKERQEKGLSQSKLAKRIGISQQAYFLYENGKRIPKYETRLRIADALGIPVSMLLQEHK